MNMKLHSAGMSLIELMVAIVIGLLVLAAITSLVVATVGTNTENMRSVRLTQEMRGAMQLIASDLRRTGFRQDALATAGSGPTTDDFPLEDYIDDPGVANSTGILLGVDDNDCILYSFDGVTGLAGSVLSVTDVNGTRDPAFEQYGVRYNANNLTVEYEDDETVVGSCTSDAGWEPMTDSSSVEILALTFGDVDGNGNFPCVDLGGGGTPSSATVREIQITLTGRLTDDPAVQKTIQDTVRVRNDLIDNSACP